MSSKSNYSYVDGFATYVIKYNNQEFKGEAVCHPEDKDFESSRVGLTIAESRANIQVLRHIRENELKPQLKVLNHLYANMKTSTHHNPASYEVRMLRSQIRAVEKELAIINNEINDERQFIKDYIDGKDKMYKRLRDKNQ